MINQRHETTAFVGYIHLPEVHDFTVQEPYASTLTMMSRSSLRVSGCVLDEVAGEVVLE